MLQTPVRQGQLDASAKNGTRFFSPVKTINVFRLQTILAIFLGTVLYATILYISVCGKTNQSQKCLLSFGCIVLSVLCNYLVPLFSLYYGNHQQERFFLWSNLISVCFLRSSRFSNQNIARVQKLSGDIKIYNNKSYDALALIIIEYNLQTQFRKTSTKFSKIQGLFITSFDGLMRTLDRAVPTATIEMVARFD